MSQRKSTHIADLSKDPSQFQTKAMDDTGSMFKSQMSSGTQKSPFL